MPKPQDTRPGSHSLLVTASQSNGATTRLCPLHPSFPQMGCRAKMGSLGSDLRQSVGGREEGGCNHSPRGSHNAFRMRKTGKPLPCLPPSPLSLIRQKEADFPDSLLAPHLEPGLGGSCHRQTHPVWEDRKPRPRHVPLSERLKTRQTERRAEVDAGKPAATKGRRSACPLSPPSANSQARGGRWAGAQQLWEGRRGFGKHRIHVD